MTETLVTTENMYRLAAELQFEVEAELGRNLPQGAIYPIASDGSARIVANCDKCDPKAIASLMRRGAEFI